MTLLSLHIGINAYGSGADLAGCVNDAGDWFGEIARRGGDPGILTDAAATKANITDAIRNLLHHARSGDTVVVTFSGHGTWVPDLDGDEADRRDEALCPVEVMRTGEVITDDELHEVFSARQPGVRSVLISDSCHSGTVSRLAGPLIPKDRMRRARFLAPSRFLGGPALDRAELLPAVPPTAPVRHPNLLMSGCADPEYSYDAHFPDGRGGWRANGAFTYVALRALQAAGAAGADVTYRNWWQRIRLALPSVDYPQTPQLYGTTTQKSWRVFA